MNLIQETDVDLSVWEIRIGFNDAQLLPGLARERRARELTTVAGAPVKYDVYACLEIARRLTQPLLSGFVCLGNAGLGFRSAKWVP